MPSNPPFRSTHYPRIANDPKNNVHLCGSWEQIVGDLDTFGKKKNKVLSVLKSFYSRSVYSSYLGIQRISRTQGYIESFVSRCHLFTIY